MWTHCPIPWYSLIMTTHCKIVSNKTCVNLVLIPFEPFISVVWSVTAALQVFAQSVDCSASHGRSLCGRTCSTKDFRIHEHHSGNIVTMVGGITGYNQKTGGHGGPCKYPLQFLMEIEKWPYSYCCTYYHCANICYNFTCEIYHHLGFFF